MRCTNQYGSDNIIKQNYITAINPLTADFIADKLSGNKPLTTHFTDLSVGDDIVS